MTDQKLARDLGFLEAYTIGLGARRIRDVGA